MEMEQQTTSTMLNQQPQLTVNRPEQEATIDLVEVFYLLWGHILQIIACFLVGAILAFGFTYFVVTPTYQASASIYVVSASNDSIVNLTDLQVGSQLTADYQELMLSRPLLQDVIRNLELEVDYKAIAQQISITNTNDTRILKITVTDTDPQQAADIANELGIVLNRADIGGRSNLYYKRYYRSGYYYKYKGYGYGTPNQPKTK